jgi:hypothetical protein
MPESRMSPQSICSPTGIRQDAEPLIVCVPRSMRYDRKMLPIGVSATRMMPRKRDSPHNDLQLVHDEQEASDRLRCSLAVVKWDESRHGTDTKASDEPADSDLHNRVGCAGLDGGTDSEDSGPEENRVAAAERVGSKGLRKRADECAVLKKSSTNKNMGHDINLPSREERSDDRLPRAVEDVASIGRHGPEALDEVGHDEASRNDLRWSSIAYEGHDRTA